MPAETRAALPPFRTSLAEELGEVVTVHEQEFTRVCVPAAS